MEQHELTCTKNPKRACYLCEDAGAGRDYPSLVLEMITRDDVCSIDEDAIGIEGYETKSEAAITWLSHECGECPACMLSVLRQGKIFAFDVFDYKEWKKEWYAEKARLERDMLQ